jgi:hypothetical protein
MPRAGHEPAAVAAGSRGSTVTSALILAIPPTLIGLTGAVGAGKDSTAAVLQRAGWRGIAFADALRIEVAEAWGVDIRTFTSRATKDRPLESLRAGWCMNKQFLAWLAYQGTSLHEMRSPRWAMQTWGTFRRSADPLYWVTQVDHWVQYQRQTGHPRMVITDVRLPIEAQMLRRLNACLVRVHRPGLPPLAADTASHESEQHTALDVDADLHNDGDLQHLEAEVARVLQQLATRQLGATA